MERLMLIATWVIAASSIIAAIAAVWSACVVRRGIEEQNKNFEKQSKAYRLSLGVEVALRLSTQFDGEPFKRVRSASAYALLHHENEENAEDVFDFFDDVGLFMRLDAVREEVAYSLFFHWINLYWRAGKNLIGARQKQTSEVWKDFEALFDKVCAIEKRRNPGSEDLRMSGDRLRSQLQEEVESLAD